MAKMVYIDYKSKKRESRSVSTIFSSDKSSGSKSVTPTSSLNIDHPSQEVVKAGVKGEIPVITLRI